jgi:hypothetical protein
LAIALFLIGHKAVSHQYYSCNEDLLGGNIEADDERDRSFGHVRVETSNLLVTFVLDISCTLAVVRISIFFHVHAHYAMNTF